MSLCGTARMGETPAKRFRVLVVDDDPSVLEVVGTMLESAGYEVVTAGDGGEALEVAEVQTPDLAVVDLVMPDVEGIELIRKLSGSDCPIPTIVMSGNPVGRQFLQAARIFGARASLVKPFSADEILSAVSTLCGGPTGSIRDAATQ